MAVPISASQIVNASARQRRIHIVSDLAVTPDGKLVVPYMTCDFASLPGPVLKCDLQIIVSDNGGRSFSQPYHGVRFPYLRTRQRMAINERSRWAASRSILRKDHIADGSIFLAQHNLMIAPGYLSASSTDSGRTWSKPLRVNDNHSASITATRPLLLVVWSGRHCLE